MSFEQLFAGNHLGSDLSWVGWSYQGLMIMAMGNDNCFLSLSHIQTNQHMQHVVAQSAGSTAQQVRQGVRQMLQMHGPQPASTSCAAAT
jgi:hypothetical protein